MEPSLGDEPKNEKALVYFESFLATGATGFPIMLAGKVALLSGHIRVAITVLSSVSFSPLLPHNLL